MTRLHDLAGMGQAIWLDFIRRSHLADGSLQALIDQGVRGVTSNPTIFEQAIGRSADYDADLRRLTAAGATHEQIYEALVLEDIATAGLPAVSALVAAGVSVNVTLIFSLAQYEAVVEAYPNGLERRAGAGADLRPVASVASFFVSRVDAVVDPQLERAGAPELIGRTAITNATLAYARFRELFAGPRWERLAVAGARVQRPL